MTEKRKIAYLGPGEKTFTGMVARKRFPEAELIPILPVRKIIRQVSDGFYDFGVVPFENFYDGEVRETLDGLFSKKANIIEELSSQVVHCLGVLDRGKEIRRVLSKETALGQCFEYLENNHPEAELISVASTDKAVEIIKNENLIDAAAIASKQSIISGKLEVIAEDICPDNRTRFAVIGRNQTMPTGDDKTLLTIHPKIRDQPGVLANCLDSLRAYAVNLEFIQSRPDGNKGYVFFLELNGHRFDANVKCALEEIRKYLNPENESNGVLKILGSYKNSRWKD